MTAEVNHLLDQAITKASSSGSEQSSPEKITTEDPPQKSEVTLEVLKYSLEQYIGFAVRQAFNYYCSLHQV